MEMKISKKVNYDALKELFGEDGEDGDGDDDDAGGDDGAW